MILYMAMKFLNRLPKLLPVRLEMYFVWRDKIHFTLWIVLYTRFIGKPSLYMVTCFYILMKGLFGTRLWKEFRRWDRRKSYLHIQILKPLLGNVLTSIFPWQSWKFKRGTCRLMSRLESPLFLYIFLKKGFVIVLFFVDYHLRMFNRWIVPWMLLIVWIWFRFHWGKTCGNWTNLFNWI